MEEPIKIFTEQEYLEYDLASQDKNEFFNGQIYAMAGASEKHNTISMNLSISIGLQLRNKPCKVYAGDMRIKVKSTGLFAYPDLLVACPEKVFSGDSPDTLLNPIVIIEILSDSTESIDRGAKFAHYRQIPSLQEYVLISQNSQKIEKYHLNSSSKWELEETTDEKQEIELSSISCVLKLEEVYEKT
ncbi:MAG: Uma2 family endonuclease [Leptospiraceae bacterium]|nr:Uma2 family endonuclease [Leptospiraceae bacterium]MCP5512956.1 Uma2 family endonuclease [Leptospiraceae bacterium]